MNQAWHALAAYTVITLAATWPLATGLGRDVAWDLGDSLLNMWILAWDSEQLLAILRGDVSRLATFFDANIFYPAPLTLAYSEHLLPQAIQTLPVYAVTRNPILCYNLLFLSTFVLSGLGMYLFVRELTGRPAAAFVAGLLFAFAPYRLPQSPHLQVLSAQWMPFALFGFHRYFASLEAGKARLGPLAGAAAALILQNLSCGYYLLFFSPFAAAYVLWQVAQRELWRQWRMWAHLTFAALVVVAVTAPLLAPYAAVISELDFERSRAEVIRFSADVYSYATAFADQPVWGDVMRGYPKPEGDLFPGLVPLLLAAIGLWVSAKAIPNAPSRPERRPLRAGGGPPTEVDPPIAVEADLPPSREATADDGAGPRQGTGETALLGVGSPRDPTGGGGQAGRDRWELKSRWIIALLLAGCVAHLAAAIAGLVYRRIVVDLWLFELQISNVNQMLLRDRKST